MRKEGGSEGKRKGCGEGGIEEGKERKERERVKGKGEKRERLRKEKEGSWERGLKE